MNLLTHLQLLRLGYAKPTTPEGRLVAALKREIETSLVGSNDFAAKGDPFGKTQQVVFSRRR